MSEEISRNDAGQFVSDAVPETITAQRELAAGYVPYESGDKEPELPPIITMDDLLDPDLRPFADEGDSALSTPESEIKRYGTSLDDLPDNVSISLEQAVEITSKEKAAEAEALEEAQQELIRNEVDKIRGETAKAAEQSPEIQAAIDQGVDPEVARALVHPQVKQALEAEFTKADQVRLSYAQGLEQARIASLAGLYEVAPHLANLPPAQIEQGLALLSEVDPPAFQRAMNVLQRTNQIVQAQHAARQQESQIQYQNFENDVRSEDARLIKMVGSEKAADEANRALISYLDQHGVQKNQRLGVIMNNPVLRTAEARQTVWKAQQYDAMKTAPKPTKNVPPVQRPGAAQARTRGTDNSSKVASLERMLDSATGTRAARIAAELHGLQRKSRS